MHHRSITRRTILRGAGVALALPWLEAMPSLARAAAGPAASGAPPAAGSARRMVCICTTLGLHAPFLFPEKAGRDYPLSPYLQPLADVRDDFTIVSGLSHPGVVSGHPSEASFLSGAPQSAGGAGAKRISLDQHAAEQIGAATRLPSLVLGTSNGGISYTRSGLKIPMETKPSALFAKLFLAGSKDDVAAQVHRLREGQSIMDALATPAKQVGHALGKRDRDRIDEYFTSVREVERRLAKAEEWAGKPKPKVNEPPVRDVANTADVIGRTRAMYDLTALALRTDSTRLVTISVFGNTTVPPLSGVDRGHHELSHHGKDPDKIAQLKLIELQEMLALRDLLAKLKGLREEGRPLLDTTMVLFGSNLGNASSHDCRNMPILLAGGGFKHGQHLAFTPAANPPLCNLYVQMLRQLGIPANAFSSSTGTGIPGLEAKAAG